MGGEVPIAAEQFPSVRPRVHVQVHTAVASAGDGQVIQEIAEASVTSSGRTPSSTSQARGLAPAWRGAERYNWAAHLAVPFQMRVLGPGVTP